MARQAKHFVIVLIAGMVGPMLGEIAKALREIGVHASSEARVLVACSGGRDSSVLAHATCEVLGGRQVVLGHVNHNVRQNADQDLKVVQELARRLHVDVVHEVLPPGPDDEDSLRRARYAALDRLKDEADADWILVAHSQDDQAETVLLAWLRTTRPDPPWGMPQKRGSVFRPMLSITRADVAAYAGAHQIPFAPDPTNLEPRYLRNRVRKELLPLLEARYRPGLTRRLAAWGELRGQLSVNPVVVSAGSPRVALSLDQQPHDPARSLPEGREKAWFDAEGLRLTVRFFQPGDRIQPFGLQGHRKVADILREGGIAAAERPLYPLVVDGEERVMWVPGLQRSAHAPISSSTRTIWVLEMTASCPGGQAARSSHGRGSRSSATKDPSGHGKQS